MEGAILFGLQGLPQAETLEYFLVLYADGRFDAVWRQGQLAKADAKSVRHGIADRRSCRLRWAANCCSWEFQCGRPPLVQRYLPLTIAFHTFCQCSRSLRSIVRRMRS